MLDLFRRRPQLGGSPTTTRPEFSPLLENLEDRLAPAIIGGTVYADLNGNGLFNAGEPGLAGSTLQLQNLSGTVLASTTSNQNGQYEFTQQNASNCAPAVQTVDAVFAPAQTNTSQTVAVNQFNPALGTLNEVDLIPNGSLSSNVQLENLSPLAAQVQVSLGGALPSSASSGAGASSSTSGVTATTGGTDWMNSGTAVAPPACEGMSGGSTTTTTGSGETSTGSSTTNTNCDWMSAWSSTTGGSTGTSTGSSTTNSGAGSWWGGMSGMGSNSGWGTSGSSTTTTGSGYTSTGSSTTTADCGCTTDGTPTATSGSSSMTSQSPGTAWTSNGAATTVTGTTSSAMSSGALGTQVTANLAGFPTGGQVNLAGPSSQNLGTTTLQGTFNQVSLTDAQDLAAYTGTGTVNVTENAAANSGVCGPANLLSMINTIAQGDVKVVYHYTPSNGIAPGQYNIVQTTQPAGYTAGLATSDNITPIAGSDVTHTIPVTVNTTCDVLTNNNFGEVPPATPTPPTTPTTPTVTPNTIPTPTPPATPDPTAAPPSKYFLISGLGNWW